MKKIFLSLSLILGFINLHSQDLLLGAKELVWDTTSAVFTPYDSLQHVYDLNGNLIQAIWRKYGTPTPGIWNYNSRTDYTYDAFNQKTEIFQLTWNGSAWQNYKHETFSYDVNGNLILNIKQDFISGAYQNVGKLEYVFVAGKMTDYNYYSWSSGMWNPTGWWQYHYNTSGLKDTALLYIYTGGWALLSRYIYQYNIQDLLAQTLIQDWNNSSSSWDNNFIDNYTYNSAGKITAYNKANWGGILWNWDIEWRYTYQNDLYLTNTNIYKWSLIGFNWYLTDSTDYFLNGSNLCDYEVRHSLVISTWVNYDSILHKYDAHGNLAHDTLFFWVNHLNSWRPYSENYWWYLLSTGIDENYMEPVKIYPNPSSENLSVEFSTTSTEIIEATLLDDCGKLVKPICRKLEAPGLVKLNADISDLPSGIYFLNLHVGDKSKTQKVIVAH